MITILIFIFVIYIVPSPPRSSSPQRVGGGGEDREGTGYPKKDCFPSVPWVFLASELCGPSQAGLRWVEKSPR
jgi:hypothetical protein